MKITKDIIYEETKGLKLDVYEPLTSAKAALLLLHGGGWFRGDKQKEAFLAEKFVAEGFLVVAPNYRLAPSNLYPSALNDVLKAYEWLKNSKLIPSSKQIFALGASAGGNLSVELALQKGIPAASWSGIIDMHDWVTKHPEVVPQMNQEQHFDEHESRTIDQNGENEAFYKWFILNYVNNNLELLKQATPLTRVSSESGPLFLANSLHELVPADGVLMLQQALLKKDVTSDVKLVAGTVHGEGYWEKVLPATLTFFNEQLL